MVHSDSDLILHNSSVLIDKEPPLRRSCDLGQNLMIDSVFKAVIQSSVLYFFTFDFSRPSVISTLK
ncbi:hypothetical protein BXA50_04815 [Enterococcus faecium]|nr:hypothetical protein BXA50_04815 [Enterococcus faecium]